MEQESTINYIRHQIAIEDMMEDMFEAWEGEIDEDALAEFRDLARTFRATLRRLGPDPKEGLLIPVLEQFRDDVASIDARYHFLEEEHSIAIKQWYEDIAAQRELCVVSLDDLDEPPSW